MHALERIERDGMRPITREAWLWRVNREWHPGHGHRAHGGKRVPGSWYSTPTRHKRQDVLADGLGTRVLRPSSRPTGRSTAIRRLQAVARGTKAATSTAVGTYAHHLATCLTCGTGAACQAARERFGA